MQTMNISLPDALKDFVEEQVSLGSYSSASEYVRELLRAAQKCKVDEKLARLLIEGMNSGEGKAITPEFLRDLQKSVPARVAALNKKYSIK